MNVWHVKERTYVGARKIKESHFNNMDTIHNIYHTFQSFPRYSDIFFCLYI